MKSPKLSVASAALATLLVATFPAVATANTDDDLARLVELNAGSTAEQLSDAIQGHALQTDSTYDEVLSAALAEAEESVAAATAAGDQIGVASSPGGGPYNIGAANHVGDVFVTPAWTGPVNHGHTGIFYTRFTIVEAPGSGRQSHAIAAANYKIAAGSVKQSVRVSTAQRNVAANYAERNLTGLDYNSNFAFNRNATASKMNCSQLVWAAYRMTAGIDLDSNGGSGVYPFNIRDSSYTTTYRTF